MNSSLPRTPAHQQVLPHNVSPDFSYEPYLLYTGQPCSSPTPFSSNSSTNLSAISPRQYQLAHLDPDLFPSQRANGGYPSTASTSYLNLSPSSRVDNGVIRPRSQSPLRFGEPNASNASSYDLRSLLTDSAAETLLDASSSSLLTSPASFRPPRYSDAFRARNYIRTATPSNSLHKWQSPTSSPSKAGSQDFRWDSRDAGRECENKDPKRPNVLRHAPTYQLAPSSTFTSPRTSQSAGTLKRACSALDDDDAPFFSSSQESSSSFTSLGRDFASSTAHGDILSKPRTPRRPRTGRKERQFYDEAKSLLGRSPYKRARISGEWTLSLYEVRVTKTFSRFQLFPCQIGRIYALPGCAHVPSIALFRLSV